MAQYQGPAIIAYNSARFQEADFQSIQRIGDSLKSASVVYMGLPATAALSVSISLALSLLPQ